jgi:hypothetical protein
MLLVKNRVANPNSARYGELLNSNPANNDVLTVIGFGATSGWLRSESRLQEVNVQLH